MRRGSMRGRALGAVAGAVLTAGAVLFTLPNGGAGAAPITVASSCLATGALTQHGSTTVSKPVADALTSTPINLSFPGDATATTTIAPGGIIDYHVVLTVNIQQLALDTLNNTIKPAIYNGAVGSGLTPAQAASLRDSAALNLRITGLNGTIPIPNLSAYTGVPTAVVSAGGPSVGVAFGAGGLTYTLGTIVANAKQATSVTTTTVASTPSFTVTLDFQAQATGAVSGDTITLHPGPLGFNFTGPTSAVGGINVSVNFFGELAGGVDGAEACTATDSVLASTAVAAPTTTTTAPSTTTTAPSTTTTAPSTTTTAPSTTTTAPSTTTTAPSTTTTAPSTTTTAPSTTTTTAPTTTTSTTLGTTTTTKDPGTTTTIGGVTTTAPTVTSTAPPATIPPPTIIVPGTTTTLPAATTEPGETTTTAQEITEVTPATEPPTSGGVITTPATTPGGGVLGDSGANGSAGTAGTGLARTGSDLLPLGGLGVLMLGLGAALVARSKRRRA